VAYAAARAGGTNTFRVEEPDLERSPFTGMARDHWKAAVRYLLAGAFRHVRRLEDFMVFERLPGKSYAGGPIEKLEGLARTLLTVAPLLREEPALELNGLSVGAYYRRQLGLLVDPTSPSHVGPRARRGGGPEQALVELAGVALSLSLAREAIWDPLPQEDRDRLAETMRSHAEGPTVPSNWRFFNVFILSFLASQGYRVRKGIVAKHLRRILRAYRGEGWYDDDGAFDYYSMWGFQTWALLWARLHGGSTAPRFARRLLRNFREMLAHYPYMFGRDGEVIAWGRSMSYRFAAVAPLALAGLLEEPVADPGWLRRICSGALLQFLHSPALLQDGVPTLGIYGPFEPAVQSYSCRGSVYWMGKAFLALLAPPEAPFWTATERAGPWEGYPAGKVHHRFHPGARILLTHYPGMGATELRTCRPGRRRPRADPYRSSEAYDRLAYHSAFPWQADGPEGLAAMNILVRGKEDPWQPLRRFTFRGFRGGVYRRDGVPESGPRVRYQLADIPLSGGVLRIDRYVGEEEVAASLGHYALPRLGPEVRREARRWGEAVAHLADNGRHQLALVSLGGWERIETRAAVGLHPEGGESVVLSLSARCRPGERERLFLAIMLWKRAGEGWTDEELRPVEGWEVARGGRRVEVFLAGGGRCVVRFG